jgi:hypothetical protein
VQTCWPHAAISLPDLYQRGPEGVRDAKIARRVATMLEDHGWLHRILEGAEIDSTRRREAWRVVR